MRIWGSEREETVGSQVTQRCQEVSSGNKMRWEGTDKKKYDKLVGARRQPC